jgi:hypothetical protein
MRSDASRNKALNGNHTVIRDEEIHLGRVKSTVSELRVSWIELKSLILAQIERWRHALHMQVERQRTFGCRRVANG